MTSDTGRSKHRVPVTPAPAPAQAPRESPAPAPPPKPAKPARGSKSATPPTRPQREGPLRHAGLWLRTAATTRAGRWGLAAGALAFLVFGIVFVLSLLPSQLESRGEKVARAWLARDVGGLKKFVEPSQAEKVPRWLQERASPRPERAGEAPAGARGHSAQRRPNRRGRHPDQGAEEGRHGCLLRVPPPLGLPTTTALTTTCPTTASRRTSSPGPGRRSGRPPAAPSRPPASLRARGPTSPRKTARPRSSARRSGSGWPSS